MHGKLITFDADNDDVQFPCIMLVSLLLNTDRVRYGRVEATRQRHDWPLYCESKTQMCIWINKGNVM